MSACLGQCSAVNESAIYGHSIQFNQEFACKAIIELGIDQYQNYNNVPHWLLKNIFAVLYVLFSVLALQPCINFKVFYINFCSFYKRLINEKQLFGLRLFRKDAKCQKAYLIS